MENPLSRRAAANPHLDLHVGMFSEQELTTMLRMLQKLCEHMGVNVDSSKQEVQSFRKAMDVHKMASELEDKLPENRAFSNAYLPWPGVNGWASLVRARTRLNVLR